MKFTLSHFASISGKKQGKTIQVYLHLGMSKYTEEEKQK